MLSVWPLSIIEQLFQEHNLERPESVLPRCRFSQMFQERLLSTEAILCHFFNLQAHDAESWDSAPSDTLLPTHMLSYLISSQAWKRDHFKRDWPACCGLEPSGVFGGRAVGLSQSREPSLLTFPLEGGKLQVRAPSHCYHKDLAWGAMVIPEHLDTKARSFV